MALKLRPTGLGSGIDKDRQDYTVYTGGWDIGRIYEVRGGPDFGELCKRGTPSPVPR
jgi:hypothetical protein